MPEEKQSAELITRIETTNGNEVSVEAAGRLLIAEDALLDDIKRRFAADKNLVWKLSPFREGSFEIVVWLLATAAPLLGDAPALAAAFRALKEFLSVKCYLGGRRYSISGGNVVVIESGESIEVSPTAIALFDPESRGAQASERAFAALREDRSVSSVGIFRSGEEQPLARVERESFDAFQVPDSLRETKTKTIRAVVGIRRPSFEEDLVWALFYAGQRIQARMADEAFMNRASSGVESFNRNDHLDVTLEIPQEWNSIDEAWEDRKAGIVITKVWDHIPPDEQLSLESDGVQVS